MPVLRLLAEPRVAESSFVHGCVVLGPKRPQLALQLFSEPGCVELSLPIWHLHRDGSLQTVLYRAISCKFVAAARTQRL